MMFESIDIIVKLLESPEPVSYEGRYWTINDMALQLRSYQQPRLPLGMATTGTRASIELAGKYGMIMLSPVGRTPPGGVPPAERWGVYAEAAREHGHTPAKENMRAVSWFHLSDTREQAWDDVRETAMRDTHYFATIGGTAGYAEYPGQPFEEFNVESIAALRGWVIGTPDDAIEAIEKIDREAGGIGGIMLSTHEWVNSHKTNYSLELFARYVMPHFRGHTQDLKAAWRRTQADAAANALPGSGSGAHWPGAVVGRAQEQPVPIAVTNGSLPLIVANERRPAVHITVRYSGRLIHLARKFEDAHCLHYKQCSSR